MLEVGAAAETANNVAKAVNKGWWIFRWLKRTKPFRRWRHWRANAILEPLHHDVVHSTRRLAARIQLWDRDHELAAVAASELCDAAAKSMAHLLALPPNHLHCCLKFIAVSDGATRIATLARSKPLDGRPPELGPNEAHSVRTNTVWSALLGGSDGCTDWTNDFTCFCCNNLPAAGDLFRCDRERWCVYYRSAMVASIRYPISGDDFVMGYVGFLAFDSPILDAFGAVPNIFDYRQNPADYKQALRRSAAFNLAGLIADTLGMFLGPVYQQSAAQRMELWNTTDQPKLTPNSPKLLQALPPPSQKKPSST